MARSRRASGRSGSTDARPFASRFRRKTAKRVMGDADIHANTDYAAYVVTSSCMWQFLFVGGSLTMTGKTTVCKREVTAYFLFYAHLQLTHLLALFPFRRVPIPRGAALLRFVPFPLASMKNSLRILCHFHLRSISGKYEKAAWAKRPRTARISSLFSAAAIAHAPRAARGKGTA